MCEYAAFLVTLYQQRAGGLTSTPQQIYSLKHYKL